MKETVLGVLVFAAFFIVYLLIRRAMRGLGNKAYDAIRNRQVDKQKDKPIVRERLADRYHMQSMGNSAVASTMEETEREIRHFCSQCGQPLVEGAQFCKKCGAKVK